MPAAYTRKTEAKDYGEHASIEGELKDGDEVVVVDDVVTRFDSKREAIDQVLAHSRKLGIKIRCQTVCVVVNRLQLSEGELQSQGVRLLSLVDFTAKGMEQLKTFFHDAERDVVGQYLGDPDRFQSIEVQKELARIGLQRLSGR